MTYFAEVARYAGDGAIRLSAVARSFEVTSFAASPPARLRRPTPAERVLFTCLQVVHTRRYRSFHVRALRRGWSHALVTGVCDGDTGRGRVLGCRPGQRGAGPHIRLALASATTGCTRVRQTRAQLATRTSRGRPGRRSRPERPRRRGRNRGLRRRGRRQTRGVARPRGRIANHLRTGPRRCRGRQASRAWNSAGHVATRASGLPGGVPALGPAAGTGLPRPARPGTTGSGTAQTRSATDNSEDERPDFRTHRPRRLPCPTALASTAGSPPRSARAASTRRWTPRRPAHHGRCGCSGADRASRGRLHRE